MTSYETIYNQALLKLEDYDLAKLPEEDLEQMLHGWMISAIAKFRKCQSDLKQRDEENKTFLVDLLDEELQIMLEDYYEINSITLTKQFFGGKEEKWFSQSQHLSTLMALRDSNRLEARKLMRDFTYSHNSYLID